MHLDILVAQIKLRKTLDCLAWNSDRRLYYNYSYYTCVDVNTESMPKPRPVPLAHYQWLAKDFCVRPSSRSHKIQSLRHLWKNRWHFVVGFHFKLTVLRFFSLRPTVVYVRLTDLNQGTSFNQHSLLCHCLKYNLHYPPNPESVFVRVNFRYFVVRARHQ